MKTTKCKREKAFIGAAISVGTQLIGGIIGGAKKRKAEKAAQLQEQRQAIMSNAQQQANILTEQAGSNEEVYKDIRNQLMRTGGRKNLPRKGVVPNITEGGTAIPIKRNTYLLKGRKHDTGGIVIGKGKNSVEAESDEVVQVTPKQLKVFSAQPIINGNSPAELVQKGAKPEKVFNAQEEFKDRNKLNNDGTKKRAMGGKDKVGSKLAESSKSQLMQRVPKYNRLYINRGNFGGGKGGGGGTETKFHPLEVPQFETVKDTIYIPVETTFNDAFANARKSGSTEFTFQGKKYNTQLGNNPNNYTAGQQRKEVGIIPLPIEKKRKIKQEDKPYQVKTDRMRLGGTKAALGISKRKPSNLTMSNAAPITSGAKSTKLPTRLSPVDTSASNSGGGFKNFLSSNKGELISAGIGAAGTLISGLMNKSSINKLTPPPTPQLVAPAQLKTSINVNPQLSDIRETELSMNRNIQGNTASSVASLARQQRISNSALSQRNKIRGEKENIETQLYNQDATNRQGVAAQNAQSINTRNLMANQLDNEKIQANANNRTQTIEGMISGVRDFQHGMDIRRRDNLAFAAELSKNPEQAKYFMTLMNRNKDAYKGLLRLGGNKLLNK